MKKIIALAMASCIALTLAACGGTQAPENADPSTAANGEVQSTGKKVGICIYNFADNFMTLYRQDLEKLFGEKGYEYVTVDGKNDQATQTEQIDTFISQGVDALVVNLVQPTAASTIIDKAKAADIPIVFINRQPTDEDLAQYDKACYVGADARQSGTFQGEMIAAQPNMGDVNGDGVIGYAMIQGDPENIDAQYRTEYSIKALTEAGAKVEELYNQRADWDQSKGQENAANALAANGDKIDVIFSNNDSMALGALQAIEAAGRTVGEDIYLVGVDALAEAVQAVADGRMTGTVLNDDMGQATTAVDCAVNYMDGKDNEKITMVDYVKVTPENASNYIK